MKGASSVITPATFQTLGELIRYLRERAHLSQRELAARVNYHYSTISRIEKNNHVPDIPTLMGRFVPALDVEDEPEWVARIMDLASGPARLEPTPVPAAPPPAESAPAPLPVPFTSLLGRERETDALWEMLRRADIRLVTLVGPLGVGKTRLAIHAAQQVTSWFPDGVIFADMAPVTEVDEVMPAIASALGIPESAAPFQLASLQSRLRNKRMLIVLDNLEQVIAAAPQVARLLAAAPDLKILATSREALRISAEHVFPLQTLPTPKIITSPNILLGMPVIRLFVDRARAVRPDFLLTEENAHFVVEICARLDGLPLAIELAAARVNLFHPRDMLAQLDRRFQWLTGGTRDSHDWRQTLRGALEWSYNLLSEEERILLQQLSVFTSGWTLQAAEAVCTPEALPLLLQLVNKSLVVAEPEHGRYHLLETMREFAHEKLAERNEELAMRMRHLAVLAGWAEDLEEKLDTIPLTELRRLVDAERNNLHAALHWSLEHETRHPEGLRLVTAISWIWFQLSHFSEGAEWAERFLPLSLDPQFKPLRARLLYRAAALSEFAYWKDKHADVKACFEAAESLARELDDKPTLANALFLHTEVYLDDQDWAGASRAGEESVALFRELAQPARLCLALAELGVALHGSQKQAEARAALDEALEIATREKYVRGEGYALRQLAHILRADGKYAEALSVNQRALLAIRASGDRINIGQVLVTMAILTNAMDDFTSSGHFAQEAYDTFQSIGSEFQQPFPERLMGYAALHTDDISGAHALCVDSIKRNHALGDDHKVGVYGGLILLAEIELKEGNVAQAARLFGVCQTGIEREGIVFQEPDLRATERLHAGLMLNEEFALLMANTAQLMVEQIVAEL